MSESATVVCSYNEWDPLEEVIVGSVLGAAKMAFEPSIRPYYPLNSPYRENKGERCSEKEILKAEEQLNHLARTLSKEEVVVRRPEQMDYFTPVQTPDFEIPCGNCSACPRDVLLVLGDEIIEAPMAQRARYFEYCAYRPLIKEYFKQGARWTAAPKPSMSDELYVPNYSFKGGYFDIDIHSNLTDFELCFDAASFVRFGRDIFYQLDVVTNDFGARWLEKHVGSKYRLHRTKFFDKKPPQHIDTTLVPLKPGIVMVNPERPCSNNMLELFKQNKWEVVDAPPSVREVEFHSPEVSNWISMNVLSLSESKIVVEEKEEPLIRMLESLGFEVITCPFGSVYKFGGGFHCCTVDIRRRGKLQSYFPSLDR